MEKSLIYVLLIFGGYSINAQKINQIESEGNLKSENPIGCVELSEVTNKNNPADIIIGTAKCIEQKQYEKAARLFMIAGAYGNYDILRVKDKTAHQALMVLDQNLTSKLDEKEKEELFNGLKKELKIGSPKLNTNCQAIKKIGVPKYYPKYMIQHGIQVFSEKDENELVENFDSEKSWNSVLKSYLHCDEKESNKEIGMEDKSN